MNGQDHLRLTRIASHPNEGTFGVLSFNGQPFCVTLEPYNMDNSQNISCINPGQYLCERVASPRFGKVWGVTHTANRSHILIHWLNFDHETKGCIGLAKAFGEINGNWAITNSKTVFNQFMKLTEHSSRLHLTITESY